MEQDTAHFQPSRITDLIALKKGGASVTCQVSFEILPVECKQGLESTSKPRL